MTQNKKILCKLEPGYTLHIVNQLASSCSYQEESITKPVLNLYPVSEELGVRSFRSKQVAV
jgi:hypothetical protein